MCGSSSSSSSSSSRSSTESNHRSIAAFSDTSRCNKPLPLPPAPSIHMTDDATRSVAVEQFIARANAVAEQRIPPLYKQLLKDSSETFAKKWLVARNFVVDDAFAMFLAACEFRLERALDSLSLFPSATALQGYDVEKLVAFTGKPPRTRPSELDTIVRNVKTCVTRCWHKFDKVGASLHRCTRPQPQLLITSSISPNFSSPLQSHPPSPPLPQAGRPVCIERTGCIQSKKLCTVTKSLVTPDEPTPLFTAHLHSVEVGRALARFNDANRPREAPEISQVLVIMDVKGLGMHTLYPPALTLLKINGA